MVNIRIQRSDRTIYNIGVGNGVFQTSLFFLKVIDRVRYSKLSFRCVVVVEHHVQTSF